MSVLRVKALVFVLLGLALGALGAFNYQGAGVAIFPTWIIAPDDASQIRFFLQSVKNEAECKQLLRAMTTALKTNCSTCRVVQESCDQEISRYGADLAAGASTAHPVALMAAGVAIFEGPDADQQLAICQKTASATGDTQAHCYPAHETRPTKTLDATEIDSTTGPLIFICLGAFCLVYSAGLWLRSTPRLLEQLLLWPRAKKQSLMVITDFMVIEASIWSAFALRFETLKPPLADIWQLLTIAPLIAIRSVMA